MGAMTNDQARLDEAVARVLNLRASRNHPKGPIISYWDEANNWERIPCPSQDWNALMAAVARLEERGYHFQRGFRFVTTWWVSSETRPVNHYEEVSALGGNEAEAVARCIFAVVEADNNVVP